MWKLKSCPRCGRDVFLYRNVRHDWYEECFRCGYYTKLESMVEVKERVSEGSLGQAEGSTQAGE